MSNKFNNAKFYHEEVELPTGIIVDANKQSEKVERDMPNNEGYSGNNHEEADTSGPDIVGAIMGIGFNLIGGLARKMPVDNPLVSWATAGFILIVCLLQLVFLATSAVNGVEEGIVYLNEHYLGYLVQILIISTVFLLAWSMLKKLGRLYHFCLIAYSATIAPLTFAFLGGNVLVKIFDNNRKSIVPFLEDFLVFPEGIGLLAMFLNLILATGITGLGIAAFIVPPLILTWTIYSILNRMFFDKKVEG